MAKHVDPRIEERLHHWLQVFEFHDYHVTVGRLPKKLRKDSWARCNWFHDNKEVSIWFAPTVGLSDENLDAIIVHELGHGKSSLVMRGPVGSVMDEQFCNWLSRTLVPECDRTLEETGLSYGYPPAVEMAKHVMPEGFTEEELLEELPLLVVRLPEPFRSAALAYYYDGKTMDEIAEGDPRLTDRRGAWYRLQRAHELLASMMQQDGA